MNLLSKRKKSYLIVIGLIFFQFILIGNSTRISAQSMNENILYNSNFYSLRFSNDTYYGEESHNFLLEIEIFDENSQTYVKFDLKLKRHSNGKIDYAKELTFLYDQDTHSIYHKNFSLIGKIPIFGYTAISEGEIIEIFNFNSSVTKGLCHKSDEILGFGNVEILSYYYIKVNEEENSTYYYSQKNPILVFWELKNKYVMLFDYLFDITYFRGNIKIVSSSYDINLSYINQGDPANYTVPIIYICSFLILFFIFRKKLKSKK